jgi:hypothetical protein
MWQDRVIILFLGGWLGICLVYLIVIRLVFWPAIDRYSFKTHVILVGISLVVSGLFLAVREAEVEPLSWIAVTDGGAEQEITFFEETVWDEHYSGFEIHASEGDDPQKVWRVNTDLPETVKLFGGTLLVRITQPEWAVFDEGGQVFQDGDGVEVHFVVDRNGSQETVQQMALNLHANPEQRYWQPVNVPIPAGSQRLHIEALPGPPGSNNWYDRVWISVERLDMPFSWIAATDEGAEQEITFFEETVWDENHTGFEIHASEGDDPQWMWRVNTDLPETVKLFGGVLLLRITQPEWAVFDEQGQVYENRDGVEVRFVVDRNGSQETVQNLTLNLHAHPEQRHWRLVKVPIPAGSQRLNIEALPGPPGSNNWNDQVWISVERLDMPFERIIWFTDWLSISLIVHLSGLVILLLSQTSLMGRLLNTVENIERTSNADTFSAKPLQILWGAFGRFGWLFTAIICVMLGYLLLWQRGFYYDDYVNYVHLATHPFPDAVLDSPFAPFPIRMISNVTNLVAGWLLSVNEFLVRSLAALGAGINALLLGWLVYRLLGSRLAAVISGWLFLMPFYSHEAVLWAGATGYILAAGLGLLLLHTFWSAFARGRITGRWLVLGFVIFVFILLTYEPPLLATAFIPILGITAAIRHNSWKLIKQLLFIMFCLAVTAALFFFLFYYNSSIVSDRGGLDLNPFNVFERFQFLLNRLFSLTISPDWGQPLMFQAFDLGLATIFQSWVGITLMVTSFIALSLTVLTWQRDEQEYLASYRTGLMMCAAGVVWFVISLLFPTILITDQWLAPRMLYYPAAGVSVIIGTLIWLLTKWTNYPLLGSKLSVTVTGLVVILSVVVMLGYARTFAARFSLDEKQVTALVQTVPSEHLPQNTIFVSYHNDEHIFEQFYALNETLYGIFETTDAFMAALTVAYQRDDLRIVSTNRWVGMQFDYVCKQEAATNILNIQGAFGIEDAPIDRIVMFSYEAGEVTVIENLTLTQADETQCTIQFPIAKELRRHGTPTTDLVVSTN